jgi:hypothetical protein
LQPDADGERHRAVGEAAGRPAATAPNATPTANPSGKLCSVIASTAPLRPLGSTLRLPLVGCPMQMWENCRCPEKPPTESRPLPATRLAAGFSDISIAGASNDQSWRQS